MVQPSSHARPDALPVSTTMQGYGSGAAPATNTSSGVEHTPEAVREIGAMEWAELERAMVLSGVSGVECSRRVARAYGREQGHPNEVPELDDIISIGLRLGDAKIGQTYVNAGPFDNLPDLVQRLAVTTESNGAMVLQIRTSEGRAGFILVQRVVADPANLAEAMVHISEPGGEGIVAVKASVLAQSLSYVDGLHIQGLHGFLDLVHDRTSNVEAAVAAFRTEHPWVSRVPGVVPVVRLIAARAERQANPWPGESGYRA